MLRRDKPIASPNMGCPLLIKEDKMKTALIVIGAVVALATTIGVFLMRRRRCYR